jgi:hypothetical protein
VSDLHISHSGVSGRKTGRCQARSGYKTTIGGHGLRPAASVLHLPSAVLCPACPPRLVDPAVQISIHPVLVCRASRRTLPSGAPPPNPGGLPLFPGSMTGEEEDRIGTGLSSCLPGRLLVAPAAGWRRPAHESSAEPAPAQAGDADVTELHGQDGNRTLRTVPFCATVEKVKRPASKKFFIPLGTRSYAILGRLARTEFRHDSCNTAPR